MPIGKPMNMGYYIRVEREETPLNKDQSIRVFERAGFTFTGYKDAGWGVRRYHFTHPSFSGEDSYDLGCLRMKARMLDIRMWHDEQRARMKFGIQEELFHDWEIEENYAITNPMEVAA